MKSLTRLALGIVATSLVGFGVEAHALDSSHGARARHCSGIRTSALAENEDPRRSTSRFNADEIHSVLFNLAVAPEAAKRYGKLRLRLTTPDGDLYQSLLLDLPSAEHSEAKDLGTEKTRKEIRKAQRQLRRRRSSRVRVEGRLPVAGTFITKHELYGTWTAELFLGDELEACTRAKKFRLGKSH